MFTDFAFYRYFQSEVKIRVNNTKKGLTTLWNLEKFDSKLAQMREVYQVLCTLFSTYYFSVDLTLRSFSFPGLLIFSMDCLLARFYTVVGHNRAYRLFTYFCCDFVVVATRRQ